MCMTIITVAYRQGLCTIYFSLWPKGNKLTKEKELLEDDCNQLYKKFCNLQKSTKIKIQNYEEEIEQKDNELQEYENRTRQWEKKIYELNGEVENYKNLYLPAQKTILDLRKTNSENEVVIRDLTDEKSNLDRKLKHLQSEFEALDFNFSETTEENAKNVKKLKIHQILVLLLVKNKKLRLR